MRTLERVQNLYSLYKKELRAYLSEHFPTMQNDKEFINIRAFNAVQCWDGDIFLNEQSHEVLYEGLYYSYYDHIRELLYKESVMVLIEQILYRYHCEDKLTDKTVNDILASEIFSLLFTTRFEKSNVFKKNETALKEKDFQGQEIFEDFEQQILQWIIEELIKVKKGKVLYALSEK